MFSQTALAGVLADAFFGLFFEPEPGPVDWKHFVAQKGYHVLLFAVFGYLLSRARRQAARKPGPLLENQPNTRSLTVGAQGDLSRARQQAARKPGTLRENQPNTRSLTASALAWCLGLGVFAECLQFFSANRNPSPWDALLNVVSALAAYYLAERIAASTRTPGGPSRAAR